MIKIGKYIPDISFYSCQPNTRKELEDLVIDRIEEEGPNCDLNDIDTSLITDMSNLFYDSSFNGDISKWDISNVEYMAYMFVNSKFNGDISNWNTLNVKSMRWMFSKSAFNGDISRWIVDDVEDMGYMFGWSVFNQDISKWKLSNRVKCSGMFYDCPIKDEFKPKSLRR